MKEQLKEKETLNRQVIINVRISNYGMHPSQRKHSSINLSGQQKEIFEINPQKGVFFNVRHASHDEKISEANQSVVTFTPTEALVRRSLVRGSGSNNHQIK
jgi:hypothetical protein